MLRRSLLQCVWVLVVVCALVSGAQAASPVLVIVRTLDTTDPAPYELRLRSELSAEGIDAIVANPVATSGADYHALASRFGVHAIIEVSVSANELSTVVWAAEPTFALEVTRPSKVSTLQRDAVGVFALRTVDFLRGARLELEQQRRAKLAAMSNGSSGTPSQDPAGGEAATPAATGKPNPYGDALGTVRPAPARTSTISDQGGTRAATRESSDGDRSATATDRFRLDLAYALLVPGSKFSWASAPSLTVSWQFRPNWVLAATLTGPYLNHIDAPAGYRSTIDQEFLQLEARRRLALLRRLDLEPYLALGGSRYAADGRDSSAPLVGHLATAWSLYAAAGGALVWHLGSHLHLVADVAGFARWQSPKVVAQLGDNREFSDLTGSSRWNLLLKLGPGWSF